MHCLTMSEYTEGQNFESIRLQRLIVDRNDQTLINSAFDEPYSCFLLVMFISVNFRASSILPFCCIYWIQTTVMQFWTNELRRCCEVTIMTRRIFVKSSRFYVLNWMICVKAKILRYHPYLLFQSAVWNYRSGYAIFYSDIPAYGYIITRT